MPIDHYRKAGSFEKENIPFQNLKSRIFDFKTSARYCLFDGTKKAAIPTREDSFRLILGQNRRIVGFYPSALGGNDSCHNIHPPMAGGPRALTRMLFKISTIQI